MLVLLLPEQVRVILLRQLIQLNLVVAQRLQIHLMLVILNSIQEALNQLRVLHYLPPQHSLVINLRLQQQPKMHLKQRHLLELMLMCPLKDLIRNKLLMHIHLHLQQQLWASLELKVMYL